MGDPAMRVGVRQCVGSVDPYSRDDVNINYWTIDRVAARCR